MDLFVIGLILLVIAASPFIMLILYASGSSRLKKLERSLAAVREQLEARLDDLEARLGAVDGERPSPVTTEAATAVPPPPAESEPAVLGSEPAPSSNGAPPPPPAAPFPAVPPPAASMPAEAPSPPAASTLTESPQPPGAARPARSSAEWEEIIGGSWLNKIGAVVTVIGIALALGYSMQYMGPAGRVALALAASGAMLAIGGLLENRERYRIFARGLIGAGWASLYFTTFAMHGLDAARIVDSPLVGTVLLVTVATGMVLHSLVYRSQTVTALAYFVTFVTIAIAPVTRFALFASLPAALSLLYVARRFRWPQMMVAGVVFTYGAYLLRGGAPDVGPDDWLFGQALLFVYWIMFETFDLLDFRERTAGSPEESMMPLNAAGFIGASLLGWSAVRPDSLWVFFVIAAGLFAASAALRASSARPAGAAAGEADSRLRFDGFEASLLIAAVMLAFAVERGFDGWRQNVAWLLEAQLLLIGGLRLRNAFMRHLGSAVLVLPVLKVIFDDLPSSVTILALGHLWQRSTPLALLTAAVLYADRALLRRTAGIRVAGLELLYNWVGTFLVAVVLASELPDPWIAPAWFALGLALAGFSLKRGASELFLQSYVLLGFSWLLEVVGNVPTNQQVWGAPARWVTALPIVIVLYVLAYLRRPETAATGEGEADGDTGVAVPGAGGAAAGRLDALADALDRSFATVLFGAATFLLSWFLLFEVSGRWLTVAWGLQGVALLVVGFVLGARRVRFTGLALLGVCIAKLLIYDVAELEMIFRIFSFIILGALLLAVSFAYGRYREQIRRLL